MSRKERMIRALGMPEDVILRVPQVELMGRGHLRLDHYKSILEFNENRLVVTTSQGVYTVEGEKIRICFAKMGELDAEGVFTSVRLGGDSA